MNEQEQNPNQPANIPDPESMPQVESGAPSTPQNQLPPPTTAVGPTYSVTPAPQTNIWAVVSLVSSILAWCGLFGIGGIIGIIAGVVARNEIAASSGTQTGEGLALAGIILGAINVFGACLVALCVFTFLGVPLLFRPFGGR